MTSFISFLAGMGFCVVLMYVNWSKVAESYNGVLAKLRSRHKDDTTFK